MAAVGVREPGEWLEVGARAPCLILFLYNRDPSLWPATEDSEELSPAKNKLNIKRRTKAIKFYIYIKKKTLSPAFQNCLSEGEAPILPATLGLFLFLK